MGVLLWFRTDSCATWALQRVVNLRSNDHSFFEAARSCGPHRELLQCRVVSSMTSTVGHIERGTGYHEHVGGISCKFGDVSKGSSRLPQHQHDTQPSNMAMSNTIPSCSSLSVTCHAGADRRYLATDSYTGLTKVRSWRESRKPPLCGPSLADACSPKGLRNTGGQCTGKMACVSTTINP